MTNRFSEVLEKRNELLHRWSIRKELLDHLEKFVDTDTRKAEIGIKTDGDGLVVPQGLIIDTRENIMADMALIMIEVTKLEHRKVAEYDDEEDVEDGEGEEEEADGEQDANEGSEEAEGDD
jgi:hypothetical protein